MPALRRRPRPGCSAAARRPRPRRSSRPRRRCRPGCRRSRRRWRRSGRRSIVLSIASSIEPAIPAANTATNETSASPIISAAAVDGGAAGVADRVLAREPAGHAAQPLERRADDRRERRDQPRAEQRDAEEDARPRRRRPRPRPGRARRRARAPSPPTPSAGEHDAGARCALRRSLVVAGTAPVAQPGDRRRPGSRAAPASSAASTVSPVPSSRPTITVRGSTTVPVVGRSMPSAVEQAPITCAKPIPASDADDRGAEPDQRTPRATTAARIWRREAPSVRSIANSRVRWATVIEKVLKIRNAADEQRDAGEDQQRRLEEADEARRCRRAGTRRSRLAGLDLDGRPAAPPSGSRPAARA